jgi:hypothetical protein
LNDLLISALSKQLNTIGFGKYYFGKYLEIPAIIDLLANNLRIEGCGWKMVWATAPISLSSATGIQLMKLKSYAEGLS